MQIRVRPYTLADWEALWAEVDGEVVAGRMIDPVITPQRKAGLKPVCVIRNYLPDEESGNNAMLLEWRP